MSFRKNIFLFVICFLFFLHLSYAQTINIDSVKSVVDKSLYYLITYQYTETKNNRFAGEWKSTMGLTLPFPLLGKPKDYEDQNCFTTAATHNCLASIYLTDRNEYSFLYPTINRAYNATMVFRDSLTFNFWHWLPSNLSKKNKDGIRPPVRRPTTFNLKNRYIKKAANVMDDADDTAEGFMALLLHNKIIYSTDTLALLPIVNNYRDADRKNFHWYNHNRADKKNSGAYLTWLGKEHRLWPKSIVNTFLQNCIFFLPISECCPKAYKPYMPYGTNDVDAIVNANILSFLWENSEIVDSTNYKFAIAFINRKIVREKFNSAAIYYPNRYHLHYAVTKAYKSGVIKLRPCVDSLIVDLKNKQQPDGSFESKKIINRKDKIQSTAFALSALLNAGNFNEYKTIKMIESAIGYLLQNKIDLGQECYWTGGVFFSGGTVVRKCLFFKSDAYTTALISQCFATYLLLKKTNEL